MTPGSLCLRARVKGFKVFVLGLWGALVSGRLGAEGLCELLGFWGIWVEDALAWTTHYSNDLKTQT